MVLFEECINIEGINGSPHLLSPTKKPRPFNLGFSLTLPDIL
jgi:hypothetical protein